MTTDTTRIDALRRRMTDTGTDLVALAPGAHMAWLLDVRPHSDERPVIALIGRERLGFLMPALEAESARQQTDLPFYEWADAEGPDAALSRLLDDLGAREAASLVLDETMRADHAALVQDALPGVARRFTADTVGALRMRKDAGEYAALKRNAAIADRAMQAAWAAMRPGMTEAEVADVVRDSFDREAARPLFTIIGAGPDGYAEVHAVVERAVQAALDAARPGVRAHAVDDAARGAIADAGYGAYFVHRTGHGLGTEVHEPPWITSTSQTLLDEGMVFSIEPGIYMPGRFGLRLEEIVILRADGPEILSDLPRDAARIDA